MISSSALFQMYIGISGTVLPILVSLSTRLTAGAFTRSPRASAGILDVGERQKNRLVLHAEGILEQGEAHPAFGVHVFFCSGTSGSPGIHAEDDRAPRMSPLVTLFVEAFRTLRSAGTPPSAAPTSSVRVRRSV